MGVLEDKLKLLPTNPGVYVMLNKDGQIIYVGKAKNLKNRVRQYFRNDVKPEKVQAMVRNIADFYYIIALSEIDALSLENNLIKKNKPRYNILLKDDKTYPYVKVNVKEDYPSFTLTRKLKKDGAKYFGPYMGGINVKNVLETLNLAFMVRPCDKKLNTDKPLKPCLNYHIKKCLAPCAGYVGKEEYNKRVKSAISFLSGEITPIKTLLEENMLKCAENEQFELALKYKETLLGLDKIALKRITSLSNFICADIIAYKSNGIYSAVNLLIIRNGRMLGSKNFSFECVSDSDEGVEEFIRRYYNKTQDIPNEIILANVNANREVLSGYLKLVLNKSVIVRKYEKGIGKKLSDMAEVNASEYLEKTVDKIKHKSDMTVSAVERLKTVLNLKKTPMRMECFDISHISGTDKVGSMVVFTNGEEDKDSYRRFKIKTVEGNNDFACLKEVLSRRLDKLIEEPEKFPKPDLIIIDGGKGQLSSVKQIFDEKKISDIDLISLAERNEEVYTLFDANPVILQKSDYCLKLLQRIRDEAHRFAITYHRSLRSKRALSSVLTGIKGLGKVKINALLDRFKDISGIISADKTELTQVEGIGEEIAQNIIEKLKEEGLYNK